MDVLKAKWCQFHEIDSDKDNDDEELDEIHMFIESDATKYIVKCDIAIRTGEYHNYYLAKLIVDIYETEESEKRMITTLRCLHIKTLWPALTLRFKKI